MKCILLAILILSLGSPKFAMAQSESLGRVGKKTLVVAKAGAYGAIGGLVVGLASQAFKSSTRNIFLFGSLGLYTGIAMGVYAISSARGGTPYEGPDTYDDYTGKNDRLFPAREQEVLLAKELASPRLNVYSISF